MLQGATINAQFVHRGKTVSARRLRNNARKLDAWFVDYRNMGYVTEVKDQVRHSYIHIQKEFFKSRPNQEVILDSLLRVTVAPAGPSAPPEPSRDKSTREPVSLSP